MTEAFLERRREAAAAAWWGAFRCEKETESAQPPPCAPSMPSFARRAGRRDYSSSRRSNAASAVSALGFVKKPGFTHSNASV